MHCPFCHNGDTKVADTRAIDGGRVVRRRRECPACQKRFTTVETAELFVQKRGGSLEPFNRQKVAGGIRKACQGRPVTDADLALIAQRVEDFLRASGVSHVDTSDVGLAVLPFLKELDQVAYLRFASVYENFASLEDFEKAIRALRQEQSDKQSQ